MEHDIPAAWQQFAAAERSSDGGPKLRADEEEEILHNYDDVLLTLGRDAEQGVGKLYVTTRRVIWLSSEDSQKGIAVDFSAIAMHAQCSDSSSFPRPCVYAQLHNGFEGDGEEEEEHGFAGFTRPEATADESAADEERQEESMELRFSPQDVACLDDMFKAFCTGASMNPDEEAQEQGESSLFFNHEEVLAGVDPGIREQMLAQYDAMLQEEEEVAGAEDQVDEDEVARYDDEDDDVGGVAGPDRLDNLANGH